MEKHHFIKADKGYYLLIPLGEKERKSYVKVPIIGWKVVVNPTAKLNDGRAETTYENQITPVALNDISDRSSYYPAISVLSPSGTVYGFEDSNFESEKAWWDFVTMIMEDQEYSEDGEE